jgi:3,4-dihydroxy 2-butanone 4-phosphate synthase/GTP cyclohydrolase II
MNEDGRMARLNDLFKFSKKHKIKLASIEDLISYRFKYEKLVYRTVSKSVNINKIGKLNVHIYKNKLEKNINFAITKGKFNQTNSIQVRVLSNKIKGKNILNNKNIKKSLIVMSKYKNFLLLIINNKNKISRENSINTLRYYGIGAQIIKDLNIKNMILISRSKKKIIGLDGFGLKIKKQIIIK